MVSPRASGVATSWTDLLDDVEDCRIGLLEMGGEQLEDHMVSIGLSLCSMRLSRGALLTCCCPSNAMDDLKRHDAGAARSTWGLAMLRRTPEVPRRPIGGDMGDNCLVMALYLDHENIR